VDALLGDLALLHDANGLLATREADATVVFVVVNNDGGGIFHFLPIREHEPHFTPLFATPHGIQPERVAAVYGLPFERVEPAAVAERVRAALSAGGSRLIEVRTNREINRLRRDAAIERARAAAVAALT
jgi:2-succinyl-5-enolpyruvyl-6-hydroxy-3-cyclohexene-1-carboxylate synthase